VFARLDELKARAREQGLDLIDLGMEIRWVTPQPVVKLRSLPYKTQQIMVSPFEGTACFRTITSWYQRRYGVDLDPR